MSRTNRDPAFEAALRESHTEEGLEQLARDNLRAPRQGELRLQDYEPEWIADNEDASQDYLDWERAYLEHYWKQASEKGWEEASASSVGGSCTVCRIGESVETIQSFGGVCAVCLSIHAARVEWENGEPDEATVSADFRPKKPLSPAQVKVAVGMVAVVVVLLVYFFATLGSTRVYTKDESVFHTGMDQGPLTVLETPDAWYYLGGGTPNTIREGFVVYQSPFRGWVSSDTPGTTASMKLVAAVRR